MKYIVILGDGMADEPIDALGGKTPLACAETPVMDELASKGEMGMVQNVPAGMAPGSDVANLSVLGYDPAVCYSGRSPLEALSVGVAMEPTDIVLRCNIVTLTEEEPYAEKTILDHSSGEISTADADILMDAIREAFNSDEFQYYTGTSSRVCKAAVKKARAQGIKLGLIRPITLWPYPKKAFDALGDQVKGFLVVEMSILGQMCDDVVLACGNKHPVESYGEFANVPSEDVILERVQEMLKKY